MEVADYFIRNTARRTTIMPFGCVHADHPGHNKELWKEFLTEAKEKDAYLIGMGDYLDFARTHFKNHLKSYRDDDESILHVDRMVRERIEEFAKDLMPLKKKIMGMLEGNHSWEFIDGTTSTQYLCQVLGVKYLGLSAFIRVGIMRGAADSNADIFTVLCHHGMGSGGSYLASDVGRFERQTAPGWDADIYLSSHTHRKVAVIVPQLTVPKRGQGRLHERKRVFAKTGCFKRAYCLGATPRSYEESKLFSPSAMGWVSIYIDRVNQDNPKRKKMLGDTENPVRKFNLKAEY